MSSGHRLVAALVVASILGCAPVDGVRKVDDPPTDLAFYILETHASQSNFALGVLIKNLSDTPYIFQKSNAKLYFTDFEDWASTFNMDWTARNQHMVITEVRVTSWEDGDSPALRLAPGQQKWLRLEGTLDQSSVRKFVDIKATYASLQLSRLLSYGWGGNTSVPFALHHSMRASIERHCIEMRLCR